MAACLRSFHSLRCQHFLRSQFSTFETLVRPEVSPVAIAPTVCDADLIEVPMNDAERLLTIQVEDDIGVGEQHRLAIHDLVVFPDISAAAKILDDGFNPGIGSSG